MEDNSHDTCHSLRVRDDRERWRAIIGQRREQARALRADAGARRGEEEGVRAEEKSHERTEEEEGEEIISI